jgi:hypothetical protein
MAHYSAYSLAIAPGTSETVAGTVNLGQPSVAGETPSAGPPCLISGVINVTGPSTAGTITVRCRQNALGGSQVEANQVTNYAASASLTIPFEFIDNSGVPAVPSIYVVTAQLSVTGGTINSIEMDVTPL